MNKSKIYLTGLIITLFSITSALAQTPDTTTLKVKFGRLHSAVVKLKDGSQEKGYMVYHFPYSPDKEISLVPINGNLKNATTYKIKNVESIDYADLKFVQIFPDEDPLEYLAREATVGELTLYTYTELVKAPVIVPVAGIVRALAIPYDNSLFFINKGFGIKKINRSKFQEELLEFVGTNTSLAEKIKNKTYKYRDIETIVKEYNASVQKP